MLSMSIVDLSSMSLLNVSTFAGGPTGAPSNTLVPFSPPEFTPHTAFPPSVQSFIEGLKVVSNSQMQRHRNIGDNTIRYEMLFERALESRHKSA